MTNKYYAIVSKILNRIWKKIPTALILLVVMIAVVYFMEFLDYVVDYLSEKFIKPQ
jgi:hypothetical protein